MTFHPRRLIEVDLPIRRISAQAVREKAIRHGHISTLHMWWARRPLAACRAVILASLLPDPVDPGCPESFRREAAKLLKTMRDEQGGKPRDWAEPAALRAALLDFIAEFSDWDRSNDRAYVEASRALVAAAHKGLGGVAGTRPLVVDSFAGGGAIPLEALRVGADAFASDLNPVAVLLNKVILEYAPKYGVSLVDGVRQWGAWMLARADKELLRFYPLHPGDGTPIAYLWARTIRCEGPSCGAEVPLLRTLWLARRPGKAVALAVTPDRKTRSIGLHVDDKAKHVGEGLIRRGSVTCPVCGYTTKVDRVRAQLRTRRGGTGDARLVAVVTSRPGQPGRFYRDANSGDLEGVAKATETLLSQAARSGERLSRIPGESTSQYHSFVNRGPIYGMERWADYFPARPTLALATLIDLLHTAEGQIGTSAGDRGFAEAVATCLALAIDRQVDASSSLCRWHVTRELHTGTFGRQALPMVWDFSEVAPLSLATGGFSGAVEWVAKVCEHVAAAGMSVGHVEQASATAHPLPDDSVQAFITDPPYYYSVQYADLSDFFYVWLKRSLAGVHPSLLSAELTPKEDEIIVQSPGHQFAKEGKNKAFYEARMRVAMAEGRRVLAPSGIAVVVFAHTSTAGWEALLQAMIDSGWTITGSWPIDTEMSSRVIAQNRSVLASSVHLVCRPRENADGSVRDDAVGDWRDVLAELPRKIHEWMPRLASEGVVGADAIFACLGPALEVYSRHSRVEKASGEGVGLGEYLEHVWAAVAREALTMIFQGAETSGFEEDARLTAMWLWTLSTGVEPEPGPVEQVVSGPEDAEEETVGEKSMVGTYSLEYDAARKIAQGLGAHLEALTNLVELKGETARLLSVAERTRTLFAKTEGEAPTAHRKRKDKQMKLGFAAELEQAEERRDWGEKGVPQLGNTVLDRVHQAMILFAAGRAEAVRRFLVEEGVGRDQRFWRLAQALAALYPVGTDERRWVEGVLARKKGLGL